MGEGRRCIHSYPKHGEQKPISDSTLSLSYSLVSLTRVSGLWMVRCSCQTWVGHSYGGKVVCPDAAEARIGNDERTGTSGIVAESPNVLRSNAAITQAPVPSSSLAMAGVVQRWNGPFNKNVRLVVHLLFNVGAWPSHKDHKQHPKW